jgi:hypothetical protein
MSLRSLGGANRQGTEQQWPQVTQMYKNIVDLAKKNQPTKNKTQPGVYSVGSIDLVYESSGGPVN